MLVSMAAAAAITERVGLAFTVIVLPLHQTGLIAKELATIDVLSAGRLSVGVGIGGREWDYLAVGAPFERRLARMEEQVGQMRRIWAGEEVVAGAGAIGPRPLQAGGPEILAGALTPKSIRRAAHWADGLLGFSFGPDAKDITEAFDLARRAWAERGKVRPPRLVTSAWYALGPHARSTLESYARRYLGFLGEEVARAIAPTCRLSSEDALRDALREAEEAGADEFILVPTSADLDQIDRVADLIGG
jgi:alkanesulfonate monooxygenase SsuD/methylene tetrahydromethanopterin reductase-like flavin-dependent oxidoreductase (luciferase family)